MDAPGFHLEKCGVSHDQCLQRITFTLFMMPDLDIAENRSSRKWTRKELAGRLLWAACTPLFRFSPRLLWGWRCFLLRLFGAKIGSNVHIHPSVQIFIPWNLTIGDWSSVGFDALIYNLGPVTIGSKVTISQRAHLCAGSHDFRDPAMPLTKPPISIGDEAWICADAFVGPGVTVCERAVVAARAVVVKDVETGAIVGGNPAKVVGKR
jgi:putative colanic acid biosynthesis acetyltransferase WcaF